MLNPNTMFRFLQEFNVFGKVITIFFIRQPPKCFLQPDFDEILKESRRINFALSDFLFFRRASTKPVRSLNLH